MGDSDNKGKSPKAGFFKGVKTEFKKISWPNKTEIVKQTVAVICISVILCFIITLLDTVLQYGVNLLTM